MRRPRHKLQVSTFPFLAVLLGAMGSLIFLLLVMDRRAKLVALNKARAAQEARRTELTKADQTRQEDWERQRQALHETLAARERTLRDQLRTVHGELRQTSQKLETETGQQRKLQTLLEAEQSRLTKTRDALRERQAVSAQSTHLETASKEELARLTRDLIDLEHTLDSLKRWKKQVQPAYSLVPYGGARGANRIPIYVECTNAGMMFLPDGARLTGGDRDILPFRQEVEKRHGPLVKAEKRHDPFQPDPASLKPYVLFLIRPNGIESFYRGQNALRGFEIDFGYELVDAQWALDIPTQPVAMLTKQILPDPPSVSLKPKAAPGLPVGVPAAGQGADPVQPGEQLIRPGQGLPPVPLNPVSQNPGPAGQPPSPVRIGYEPEPFSKGQERTPGQIGGGGGPQIGRAAVPGQVGPEGSPAGSAPQQGSGQIGRSLGQVGPEGSPAGSAPQQGSGQIARGPGQAGTEQNPGLRFEATGKSENPPAPPTLSVRPGQPNSPPTPPLEGTLPALKVPGQVANEGVQVTETANAKRQAAEAASGPQAKSNSEPGAVRNPLSRLGTPSIAHEKAPPASPASLGRVIGNRDFVITIACYGEGVILTPGGKSFVWKGKTDPAGDEALVRAVSQLVTSRQATVRTGEPRYRVVLRFQVHEQGRRTYYRVYPLLENMRFAMVREDVEE
jgi:hypothetical protein